MIAERLQGDRSCRGSVERLAQLAVTMGAVPAEYFKYYYFEDEVLAELRAKPTTRAEDILSWAPGYWDHYAEQVTVAEPNLDPARSRGGIHELELAIDVMDAVFNGKDEIHPVNVPNRGGVLPGLPEDLVVEVYGRTVDGWIEPQPAPPLPRHVLGLIEALGEYEYLAADAAWSGTAATPCARWPRTRWCARCRGPSGCTPSSPQPIAHICPDGSPHEAARRSGLPGRPPGPRHAHVRPRRPAAGRGHHRAGHGAAAARQRQTVLIDAGSGIYDPDLPGTELLDSALAELGVSVGDVDTLVLTHMDGDHAGGALAGTWPDDVRAVFKRVVILDEASTGGALAPTRTSGAAWWRRWSATASLEPVASGHEFAPHLRLESAPGHRPGHAAVWIGDEFVHGGDILHVVEHVANPAWDYYYDTDVALALQTRQEWIDRLIETGTPVLFAHIAARGRIVAGPAWQPEQ